MFGIKPEARALYKEANAPLLNQHQGRNILSQKNPIKLAHQKKTKMDVKSKKRAGAPVCACGRACLGPLRFHAEVKGRLVALSNDGRRATRDATSFRHGLIFSNRPVKLRESVCLRVERSTSAWYGALRVGFTSVDPASRQPLPSLAIPDLTDTPGYWAVPVPEQQCRPSAELRFWLDGGGSLCFQTGDGRKRRVKTSADTRRPLWAMIDVYGQTNAVRLLGSEKKGWFITRRSCFPPTEDLRKENSGPDEISVEDIKSLMRQNSLEEKNQNLVSLSQNSRQTPGNEEECVVCFSDVADVLYKCGHRCVCSFCAPMVHSEFGTCPLCRQPICT